MTKVISVAIPKGGVGKTTTAVNLAASLAAMDNKTLLIDMDPAGACSIYLGFREGEIKADVFGLLGFINSFKHAVHKTEMNNLTLLPSLADTYQQEEKSLRISKNMHILKNILERELHNYNYVIIDTPPYLSGPTTLALAASNSVILPVKSGNFSLTALKRMVNHIVWVRKNLNPRLNIEGVIQTMFEMNTKVAALTQRRLYHNFGKYVFITQIPKNITLAEATFYGRPAILYNAKSTGAESYLKLAEEVTMRNKTCPLISVLHSYSENIL